MTTVLTLDDLHVEFGGNQVLEGVDLAVGPGFTGLVGPNGAGKTTIFNAATGYVRPSAGRVLLDGRDVTRASAIRIARAGVSRTFQTPKLVAGLSVLDNVRLGLDGKRGVRRRDVRARSLDVLDAFGLAARAGEQADAVPLAVQKVVEVARALVGRPRLVLLDEPAAGLSAGDVEQLVPPLLEVTGADDIAVVIIEHDVELVSRVCPTVAVLHFGRTLAVGDPQEVMKHPEVLEAYLGASVAAVD